MLATIYYAVDYKSSGVRPVVLERRASMRGPISSPVVKGKYNIRPTGTLKHSMGTGCSFNVPADAKERRKHPGSLGGRPLTHAAMKETFSRSSGKASLCSRRSAITRSARA